MTKQKNSKMELGFNHNIKHNGKVYHVQTEDSGVNNPHIITHLFVGGNILATKKTSYADIVQAANFNEVVRELMEEQHKAMLRNLVNGVYDNLDNASAEQALPASQMAFPAGQIPKVAKPAAAPASEKATPKPPAPVKQPAFPPAQKPASTPGGFPRPAPVFPVAQPGVSLSEAPTQVSMPAFSTASKKEDLGTQIYTSLPSEVIPQKPEPQRVTLKPKYSSANSDADSQPVQNSQGLPPEVLAARRMVERPTPKDTSGPTIFGEDLISEKSLDEVILGYLAGEGEGDG